MRDGSSRIHHHVATVWRAPGRMLTVSGIGQHHSGGNVYLWTMSLARHYGMCRLFVRLFEHGTAKQVVPDADPTGDQRSPGIWGLKRIEMSIIMSCLGIGIGVVDFFVDLIRVEQPGPFPLVDRAECITIEQLGQTFQHWSGG